jgi:hypothetical protein
MDRLDRPTNQTLKKLMQKIMPRIFQIKGRFSEPCSSPDAFGLPYPGAFLFGEHGAIGSQSFGFVGTDVRGCIV